MKSFTKPLAHYEDFYLISNQGQIFTRETGKELKPTLNQNGYLKIAVSNRLGNTEQLLIHRLVALHFIPNPYQYSQVNHCDGNKLNNIENNLEWCTSEQNIQHALKNGFRSGYLSFEDREKFLQQVLIGRQVNDIAMELDRRPETLHKMLREAAKKLGLHAAWEAQMKENRRDAAIRNLTKINN